MTLVIVKFFFYSFFEQEFYFSKAQNLLFTQVNCSGKKFIVNTKVKNGEWKITDDVKKIKGYNCMKAVRSDSLITAVVWFTPEVHVQSGPKDLLGLPGLAVRAVIIKTKKDYYSSSGYSNIELVIEL